MTVENPQAAPFAPDRTLGDLVAERPARARFFERLHIDYCCGGTQTLAQACAAAGAQLETVQLALEALDEAGASGVDAEHTDWRGTDTQALCDHIVQTHHDYLRRVFPRVGELAATVVRVHGAGDASLSEVQATFERVRSAMEPHLGTEENDLFPAIVAAERGGHAVAKASIVEHQREHAEVGVALSQLRVLCHDYDRARAHCNTHLALIDALEELEHDLHQHVHEENNVLFARALEFSGAGSGTVTAG